MKLKSLLLIVALAVLIGGAYLAYDALAEESGGSNLQILDNGQSNPSEENPPAENPPEENPPAEDLPEENPPEENPPEENPPEENPPAEDPPAEDPPAEDPPSEVPVITPSAADFTVFDMDGNAVKLSDYFGKPIVINFFASWCGPCRIEMPAFQAEYDENKEEIAFLFISVDDTMADAKKFVDEQGYTFPILHDRVNSAAIAYSIRSIPATFFISREGHLVAQAVGRLSAEDLALGIEKIK